MTPTRPADSSTTAAKHRTTNTNRSQPHTANQEGKVIGPWNETVTGAFGIFKAVGHMYQAEDKALEYYLEQMTDNCD